MIGKTFEFKGQTISNTTLDYIVGLEVVQWKSLEVSDSEQNIQGFHGVKLSPTFARGRNVVFEGVIIADNQEGSSKGIEYLENLFSLQGIPSQIELSSFIVTDEQDKRRELQAKIKEPLSIDINDNDFLQGATRRWRVVLQAEDPRYYNTQEQVVTGTEGHFGGVKFPVKFGVPFNEYFNEIQVVTGGNIETFLNITITANSNINKPLTIKNITTGEFFGLDIDTVAGDIIVVNGNTFEATKNDVNIKATRVSGSVRPKVKGTNLFTIYDQDGGLFESDFDISIAYKDVLL